MGTPPDPSSGSPGSFENVLQANRRYAEAFSLRGIPARAAKGFALLTCMDSRIEPLAMLGLVPGDAKILRNAGGRVTEDVLRSLVLATAFLGVSRIAVMQHTNCALAHRTDQEVRADLPYGRDLANSWDFHTMADPDKALREDVEKVRACRLLPPTTQIEGWRYDVENGVVHRVIPAENLEPEGSTAEE